MWWLRGPMFSPDGDAGGGNSGEGGDTGGDGSAGSTDLGDGGTTPMGDDSGAGAGSTDTGDTGPQSDGTVEFTPEQRTVISKMISGRVGEVKKQYEGSELYKQTVEMIGDIIGSKDINVISQHLKGLHAQHQAKQMGMTPEGYTQYQRQTNQTQQQLNEIKLASIRVDFDKLKADPKFVDAEFYGDQIVELSLSSGLSVEKAYWAVAGESVSQKKSSSAAADAEHRTINNMTNNRTKQVQGGDSGGQKGGPQVTADIREAASKVGMDPVEYMRYQNITTIEEARAARPQK